jgi:hypothetical protein
MRKRSVLGAAFLMTLTLGFSLMAPAYAVEDGSYQDLPVAEANPNVSREVIESLPEVVQQSNVKIADSIRPDTLFRYPSGKLVEGQEQRALRCGAIGINAIAGGAWSGVSQCTTALLGHPGLTVTYRWASSEFTDGSACLQFRGSTSPTNTSRKWYGGGCGDGGSAAVFWGNVADYPAARARAYNVVIGWSGRWDGPM